MLLLIRNLVSSGDTNHEAASVRKTGSIGALQLWSWRYIILNVLSRENFTFPRVNFILLF